MEQPGLSIDEKRLRTALYQFVFPFSIESGRAEPLKQDLIANGYTRFSLANLKLEKAYYGPCRKVSHRAMESEYLPFTANILFPPDDDPEAFQRYSRASAMEAALITDHGQYPFLIHSVDVILCPFELGLITIRVEYDEDLSTLTDAIEFADRLRVLQKVKEEDKQFLISCQGKEYEETADFIFSEVAGTILPYLNKEGNESAYFETLPFFVDEKMYVIGLYSLEERETLDDRDRFRAIQLDGLDRYGNPYISSSHMNFIQKYVEKHSYSRWSPDTTYLFNEHSFCCLTRVSEPYSEQVAGEMDGELYYTLLLNLFHKLVLLKLSDYYAHIRLERDNEQIRSLIGSITVFTAKYYFVEFVSPSKGKELFAQLRLVFGNNELYEDVKQTLTDLFNYQNTFASSRQNLLLTVLTIYSVVGGIYGMNQVIDDLESDIDWSKVLNYSLFEFIALFVTFSGLAVGIGLGACVLWQWIKELFRKRQIQKKRSAVQLPSRRRKDYRI